MRGTSGGCSPSRSLMSSSQDRSVSVNLWLGEGNSKKQDRQLEVTNRGQPRVGAPVGQENGRLLARISGCEEALARRLARPRAHGPVAVTDRRSPDLFGHFLNPHAQPGAATHPVGCPTVLCR